jgi:hypothetical protein
MTDMLKIALQMDRAGPSERKRLLERVPKEHMTVWDGKWVRSRELLLSNEVAGTHIIPVEVYNTVVDGAKPFVCMREAMWNVNMDRDQMKVPYGAALGYAPEVAPGAEIPINTDEYSSATLDAVSLKERPAVTQELVDDAKWDIIEREYMLAGARIEMAVNRKAIVTMIDASVQEHDCGGSNLGIKAINTAQGLVKAAGFIPDVVVMHPDAETVVKNDFVPTNYEGAQAVMAGKLPPNLLGLKAFVCGIASNGTRTWDYDTNDEIGMIVFDSMRAGALGIRKDINVEEYRDPVRDLVGAKVTMRYDVKTLQVNAACRVRY